MQYPQIRILMDTQKIIQTLVYLASKQPNKQINKMKAYKLMWLVDRYHLRQYGRTVTGDAYYALPHGVVPTDAKHLLEDRLTRLTSNRDMLESYIRVDDEYVYSAIAEPNMDVFSDSDIEAMNKILDAFGGMNQYQLSDLSHQFPEWLQYEPLLVAEDSKNSYKIDLDLFFENKDEASNLFVDPEELLSLTKQVFHEYRGC